jgi:hypothetical protein
VKLHGDLSALGDDELLKLRFCDLGVGIKGTWLEECVHQLYAELEAKGIAFRPQCYLADEWLTPDNEPVVGIAFYLAHPRLQDLERRMMHEVEGGDKASCMKLLRHETGHAINYAYRLYGKKRWKGLFGRFFEEYPDRYKYHPYSRSFVIHLDDWYAQYHPDEDFAETFAVWLAPDSNWKMRYAGWKALEKLEYVDTLLATIGQRPPRQLTGKKHWNISTLKTTLKTHYKRKTEFYAEYSPDFHDLHLSRIFSDGLAHPGRAASRVLAHYRKDILDNVAFWTGERKYIIDRLLKNLIKRCGELHLSAGADDARATMMIATYITTLIMNYIYTGRFKRKK